MKLRDLDALSRAPHGLLVRSDLLRAGFSPHRWRQAIVTGSLIEVMPGVAVVPTRPITDDVILAAAVASTGPNAVLSHRSAARLWGVEGLPERPIDVTRTDPRARPAQAQRAGVMVHRPRDLMDVRPITVRELPVTNPVRTLLDLGAVAPHAVDRALTHFRVSRRITLAQVRHAIADHSTHGRSGLGPLRAALRNQHLDDLPPDSQLEETMARLIRRFSLPPMQFHARLAGYEVDFWIVGTCLYLECDGWAAHGLKRDQFEFDRTRTSVLSAAGLVGIRVTWRQVTQKPREVAELIVMNLERWAPELLR